jgi:nucleoside 2-deoxyribosyltransferase
MGYFMREAPLVYLAGPDVFCLDARAIFDRLKACCTRLGLVGVEPSDGGLGDAGNAFSISDDERAQRIFEANIALIRDADAVAANLVNFRGHEPDSGTVFEVGFAVALGKPVVAYGVAEGSYADRVSAAIPCQKDGTGLSRETANGMMVEGLGQRLNLMLSRSAAIESSAEAALARLASQLGAKVHIR